MYKTDEHFMRRAMGLAQQGRDTVGCNPLVGAMLVDGAGCVLGSGWHRGPGTPHAEVVAIQDAQQAGYTDFSNSTLYVNLEPCCHTGRTPPCTGVILGTNIPRIVCGMTDPNPLVQGKGIRILREANRSVISGVLEEECRDLNASFVTFHEKNRPFFTLKTASSLDGKTAASNGQSRWITGEASRVSVHHLRARQAAIITGIGTVLADDPLLTVRVEQHTRQGSSGWNPPARIVVDTRLRLPLKSRLVSTAREIPVYAACSESFLETPEGIRKKVALEHAGVIILPVQEQDEHIYLEALATILARHTMDRVLIETGETLAGSFLKSGLVDRIRMYVAPCLLGGITAPGLFRDGVTALDKRITLTGMTLFRCGEDIVLEGRPCSPD